MVKMELNLSSTYIFMFWEGGSSPGLLDNNFKRDSSINIKIYSLYPLSNPFFDIWN